MEEYNCVRCGHTTNDKGNLIKHLRRKFPCKPLYQDEDREFLINLLYQQPEGDYECLCDYCDKKFKYTSSFKRHLETCKKKPNEKDEEIKKLKDMLNKKDEEIDILKKNPISINNTVNNNINQSRHIHFHLNNFGNENLKAIPDSYIRDIFLDPRYDSLFENMHCDKDFPENHNIRIKSSKRRLLEIFRDNEWKVTPFKNGFEDVIIRLTSIFKDYYRKNPKWVQEDMTDEEVDSVLDELGKINELQPKYVKPIIEQLVAILETNRDMLNKEGPLHLDV